MKTRVSVSLEGEEFSEIDERIIIQNVEEPAPKWNISMTSDGRRYGQRVTAEEKQYREIILRFAIREHRDLAERENVLQAARDWARHGGWMEISYREYQRLHVMCAAMPAMGGITKSADNYAITFRTDGAPEWESNTPTRLTVTGKSGTAIFRVNESAGGPIRLSAKISSGTTCNVLQITSGEQTMRFENLGLKSGETFQIEYSGKNLQSLRILAADGTARSAMDKRTTGSCDDIMMSQGENKIEYSAGTAMEWNFYTYGRWAG